MTSPVTHRPPWTVRVATFSARHRWPVIALWKWWMPRFSAWIPRVTIEGESDEREVGPEPAPAPAGGTA